MATKAYKIRKFQNGRSKSGDPYINYSLTIPTEIAEKLPQDVQYTCTLTEAGILFQPVTAQEDEIELPAWARKNGNGQSRRARPGARA